MAKFFENSLKELVARNPNLEYNFRRIDANSFTAAAYRDGRKVCKGALFFGKHSYDSGGIEYAMTDAPSGGMNEAVHARADDQTLYFEPIGMQSSDKRGEKLSQQGAAELFWSIFIQPPQTR